MDEVSAVDGGVAVGGDARVSAQGGVAAGTVKGGVHYHAAAPAAEKPGPVVALPSAPPVFVGRETEGDHILGVLRPDEGGTASVVVSAVAGLGGIGKTALVLHAAHHAVRREWFTDAVFVDLRGYDPDPLTAHQALDVVLRTLRVPADDIPATPDERAGLLGSVLNSLAVEGRRVLVVADNASSSDQIRPLLPTGDRHRLLVTSRHTHPDLGARLLDLDTLSPEAGVDLVRATLEAARPGDTRTHDAPQAALELAAWCGGLPLALRINAAALVLEPEQSIPELLGELRAHRSRIDAVDAYTDLTGTQRALRATFDLSHQHLPARHRQLLHLLAIAPGPDIGLPAATALAGRPEPEVRAALRELTRAHLLTHRTGPTGSRWAMHDLTRDHNSPAAPGEEDDDGTAMTRLLTHYAHTADAADDHLRALLGEAVPADFPDRAAAFAWFDAERDNLLAAIRAGRTEVAARFATFLAVYLSERRRFDDAIAAHARAVEIFRSAGNRTGEGHAQNNLGNTLQDVGRFGEAVDAHTVDLAICQESGDLRGEGQAQNSLGLALQGLERFREAVAAHTEAVDISRRTGDRQDEGHAQNGLGLALQGLGLLDASIATHSHAVAILRGVGDRGGQARALNNLGAALAEAERPGEAVDAYTQCLAISRDIGGTYDAAIALGNLGLALTEMGRFGEAADAHTEAADLFREAGDAESALESLAGAEEARQAAARQ